MRSIFSNDRALDLLEAILRMPDERDVLYVYRLDDFDRPVRPAMIKCQPFFSLYEYLRDECGGGAFRIMIRRGETMLIAGRIDIGSPSIVSR